MNRKAMMQCQLQQRELRNKNNLLEMNKSFKIQREGCLNMRETRIISYSHERYSPNVLPFLLSNTILFYLLFIYTFIHFFSPISWYPIGIYSLIPSLQLPFGLGRGAKVESSASWHNAHWTRKPATPMCRGKHRTPGDRVSMHCSHPATGVASARWDKNILPAKPSRNPDDAGPIVRPAATEPGLEPGSLVAQPIIYFMSPKFSLSSLIHVL
jgi:hypothetical protein